MTKIARLPDGQMHEFPDEMPDDQMHREVKKLLGIEVPPTPEEMMRSEDTAATAARNQALNALVQQVGALGQVIGKLCADQQATQRLLAQTAGAIGRLGEAVGAAAQRVETAVMAPATQTVERGEDGKIEKTMIVKGQG